MDGTEGNTEVINEAAQAVTDAEADEAAFDAFVGGDDTRVPDARTQLAIKRDSLAKAINTRFSLREEYRYCKFAGDDDSAAMYKDKIKGWSRAIDKMETEIRDLEHELGEYRPVPISRNHAAPV